MYVSKRIENVCGCGLYQGALYSTEITVPDLIGKVLDTSRFIINSTGSMFCPLAWDSSPSSSAFFFFFLLFLDLAAPPAGSSTSLSSSEAFSGEKRTRQIFRLFPIEAELTRSRRADLKAWPYWRHSGSLQAALVSQTPRHSFPSALPGRSSPSWGRAPPSRLRSKHINQVQFSLTVLLPVTGHVFHSSKPGVNDLRLCCKSL